MVLPAGAKLGPYEILSPVGAGGMGEVYRARDTRLDRTIAIKVLNSQLVGNAELRGRFEREAKIISQLQHPHICVLHDVGSEGSTEFLVMEFLEGESLADRLKRGPLPQAELLKIAVQISDALEKAHRAGVVHRDLKPGNVMLTKLGAKLLDFGLAKPAAANVATRHGSGSASVIAGALTQTSPTATPLSTVGAVIGTVQYMSPEQIQGIEADARSDIFAFGAMLYEMATGKRAFEGKTQASIVGQILAVDPPAASTVRPETSPALDRVIRLCLEKDADERIQTAHDLKLNLQAVAEHPADAASVNQQATSSARGRTGWIAALIAALALGALAAILLYHPAKPASTRTSINPPPTIAFHLADDWAGPPVLSPDGKLIAFTDAGKREIWVRPVNSLEAHPLEGTTGATFPFWSPDSRSLAFFIVGKGLKRVDLNGGPPTDVAAAMQGRGGAWGSAGVIVFSPAPDAPLMKVNANGGTAELLTKIDPSMHTSHRWPAFLPDGKHILYLALNHEASKASNDAIYYASLDGRENRLLFHTQSSPVYAAGYLLFVRGDKLLAQSFEPAKGELKGDPQPVASGVILDGSDWHMDVSATEDGLLVYGSGATRTSQLVWLDRSGKDVGVAADNIAGSPLMHLSPEGDRVALQMESGMGTADIYVLDLARGVRTRLTFGPVSNVIPRWSPDGKWIYYSSLRNGHYGMFRRPADASGDEESVFAVGRDVSPADLSPDGKTVLMSESAEEQNFSIWALPLAEPRKPRKIIEDGHYAASFSPDGRYVVYDSRESGQSQVYVVPFGDRKGRWQVSSTSGAIPRWSKDGKEIDYVESANGVFSIVAVPVKEQGDQLQFGSPQTLVGNMNAATFPTFDVSPDGKKILLPRLSQQGNQSVTLVTNFTEGLKK
jgi:eukaryotic-like serine/threonine-protein kinase